MGSPNWTAEELAIVREACLAGDKLAAVVPRLPSRTRGAINQQMTKLRAAGICPLTDDGEPVGDLAEYRRYVERKFHAVMAGRLHRDDPGEAARPFRGVYRPLRGALQRTGGGISSVYDAGPMVLS